MPQATDLVLNNAAAVAKTFTLLNPSAGENSVANWALKEGAINAVFPKITSLARPTGNKSRLSQHKLRVPSSYTDAATSLTKAGSAAEANISVTIPDDYPEALKNDFVAYTANMVAHALIKAVYRDGYPAT